jgi:DNA helicase HerA-like ATPase
MDNRHFYCVGRTGFGKSTFLKNRIFEKLDQPIFFLDPHGHDVLLVHARTDTRWFHDFVYGKAELRFVRGRLKFGDGTQSAPFPSLVAIYRPKGESV